MFPLEFTWKFDPMFLASFLFPPAPDRPIAGEISAVHKIANKSMESNLVSRRVCVEGRRP